MAQAVSLQQLNYRLRKHYNRNPGVPKALVKMSGSGWKSLKRMLVKTLNGQEEFISPVVQSLPGAGGPNLTAAIQTSTGLSGTKFKQTTYHRYRTRYEWQWNAIFQGESGENVYQQGGDLIQRGLTGTVERVGNNYSMWMYGDGGGAVAKIDPSTTINIGDTSVTVLLPRSLINFEEAAQDPDTSDFEGGDYAEFSVTKGTPGTVGTVKPYTSRIIGLDRETGLMTLETPIPDDGFGAAIVQPGDYIFHRNMFGKSIEGIDSWTPINHSKAFLDVPFHGVTRSSQPQKLAGLAIKISAGQDAYPQIVKICKRMMISGSKCNTVVVTPEVWENIQNSMETIGRKLNGTSAARPASYTPTKGGGLRYSYELAGGLEFTDYTGNRVLIVPDEYLMDIDQGPSGQTLYRGWNDGDLKFNGTIGGSFTWVNLDGVGIVRQHQDQEIVSATYSVQGLITHEKPLNGFVASPHVIL